MCGIAGEFVVEREQVQSPGSRMIAAVRHRSLDSSGHYVSPAKNVLLVNTRLAVIDVGDSTQPLRNGDGAVWILPFVVDGPRDTASSTRSAHEAVLPQPASPGNSQL